MGKDTRKNIFIATLATKLEFTDLAEIKKEKLAGRLAKLTLGIALTHTKFNWQIRIGDAS